MWWIVVAPPDDLFDKTASNLQEVVARGGKVISLMTLARLHALGGLYPHRRRLLAVDPFVALLLYAMPVQLLDHIAVLKGTDVDQPRNLAKSVTVE